MKNKLRDLQINFLLLLLGALVLPGTVFSQPFTLVETPGGSTSSNRRGPCTSCGFQAYVGVYPAAEVSPIIPANDSIAVVGWNLVTPLASPQVSGNIVILLSNTTDATYNKGATWTGAIAGMDTVYVGPLTIDTVAGAIDLVLQNKFEYTGDGLYFAWQWTTSNQGGSEATYAANTSVDPGMVRYFNNTGHTNALGATAVWRTQLRLGYPTPAVDLALSGDEGGGIDCGSTSADFNFTVDNLGANDQDTIFIEYDLVGPGVNTTTLDAIVQTVIAGQSVPITITITGLTSEGDYFMDARVVQPGDAFLGNDTANTAKATNFPELNSYPYTESFEPDTAQDWSSNATGSSMNDWQLGIPAGSVINSAASAPNSWVTNLTGNYGDAQDSWVTSPCFDFTSMVQPNFVADIWYDIETDWDAAILEGRSSTSGGWITVGGLNTGTNWYNSNSVDLVNGLPAAWNGSGGAGSGGWVTAIHDLDTFAGQTDVQLRFHFYSDGNTNNEGMAFDNVDISDAAGSAPTADFSFSATGLTVDFTDASIGTVDSYLWDFGDGATDTTQNPTHTYAAYGNYTACLTATNSNGSDSSCQTVMLINSLETVFGDLVKVYPNPASESVNLEIRGLESDHLVYRLRNSVGQPVVSKELSAGQSAYFESIDVKSLPAGIYFLEIDNGIQKENRRIIIE